MNLKSILISLTGLSLIVPNTLLALPPNFVYLSKFAPSIQQEIRYAGYYNFVGRPIKGYYKATCILTQKAAARLANIQKKAHKQGYSLKVYDCYRPQRAVDDFYRWSRNRKTRMKREFYPREAKKNLFKKGYIAKYSGHSRGSTVDVTLVKLSQKANTTPRSSTRMKACYLSYKYRNHDNSIDMGSNYDCLDRSAHRLYPSIAKKAKINRSLLRRLMLNNGFYPYAKEWWHFTLRNEPFKRQYFNFPVR